MPAIITTYGGARREVPTRAERQAMPKTGFTRSWQAADKIRQAEAVAELRAIKELLETGCGPSAKGCCENCSNGLHDDADEHGNCTCCGTPAV